MAAPALMRVVEREVRVYGKLWRSSIFSIFVIPVVFLVAMGHGIGALVDDHTGTVAGVSYLHFVTPGLLAAMTMQGAAPNSLWTVMAGTKWVRFFHGVVATPISPGDMYGGYVLWNSLRSTFAAVGFMVAAALLGGVPSVWGVLAIPAAGLCAMAFTAPLVAFAATQTTDVSFGVIMRLVITPLFLFSGSFFPIDDLPGWLEVAAKLSPLWHAVELCRAATIGSGDLDAIAVHVAFLVAVVIAGWMWGTRTFTRKLGE